MKAITGLFIFIFFLTGSLYSQDTITLLDGKTITGNIIMKSDTGVVISSHGLFSIRQKRVYNDEIFSLNNGSSESIMYKQDSSDINSFNVTQMSSFIDGLKDGRKNYHAPMATIGGFVAGATGGVLGFWGLFIPSTYVFIAGTKTPKLKTVPVFYKKLDFIAKNTDPKKYGLAFNSKEVDETNSSDSYYNCYKNGYQEAAKDKKVKNAIVGSILGVVTFIAGSYMIVRM